MSDTRSDLRTQIHCPHWPPSVCQPKISNREARSPKQRVNVGRAGGCNRDKNQWNQQFCGTQAHWRGREHRGSPHKLLCNQDHWWLELVAGVSSVVKTTIIKQMSSCKWLMWNIPVLRNSLHSSHHRHVNMRVPPSWSSASILLWHWH